jgi:glycosyltransferase involved in cell wall biosynthesis
VTPLSNPEISPESELSQWLSTSLTPGRILSVGTGPWPVPMERPGFDAVHVEQIIHLLEYRAIFDHAWIRGGFGPDGLPENVLSRAHHALKPGGTLLLAVPFGMGDNPSGTASGQPFYPASLRRLIDALFDITDFRISESWILVAGRKRPTPLAAPQWGLTDEEEVFRRQEAGLRERIKDQSAQLIQSGARYRGAMAQLERVQAQLKQTSAELASLRRKVKPFKPFAKIPLAVYRKLRRRRSKPLVDPVAKPQETAAAPAPAAAPPPPAMPSWKLALRNGFEDWLARARGSAGEEVVLMFSGTTYVQEQRGNRPIRLTNVYLRRQCPVFFNYYRWKDTEPLPEHPDRLLFQSPIDATPDFLYDVLSADFGTKRKLLYASFPHELMVRYLTLAAQHGWVTIYDARDDWEEFAKVGMAKWYKPSYERYVAWHADIVTAVSRPLARKMSVLAGGRTTHVSANALDTTFPRPEGGRVRGGEPVIGYFGHLTDKWFDWPLMIAAAKRYPAYKFEFAGHQAPSLELPPNIKLLGLLGHKEIAERSRKWSLALIPFINGPLADAVDPIKIYEYLHLGLPVLASYFPQCRDYPATTISESQEEFLRNLPRCVGQRFDREAVERWLAENTWECRIDRYSELAEQISQGGRAGANGVMGLLEGER